MNHLCLRVAHLFHQCRPPFGFVEAMLTNNYLIALVLTSEFRLDKLEECEGNDSFEAIDSNNGFTSSNPRPVRWQQLWIFA